MKWVSTLGRQHCKCHARSPEAHAELKDPELLDRAQTLKRVLFTQDDDLLSEAVRRQRENVPFYGVIYAHQFTGVHWDVCAGSGTDCPGGRAGRCGEPDSVSAALRRASHPLGAAHNRMQPTVLPRRPSIGSESLKSLWAMLFPLCSNANASPLSKPKRLSRFTSRFR
jgi:hypothetical protein